MPPLSLLGGVPSCGQWSNFSQVFAMTRLVCPRLIGVSGCVIAWRQALEVSDFIVGGVFVNVMDVVALRNRLFIKLPHLAVKHVDASRSVRSAWGEVVSGAGTS